MATALRDVPIVLLGSPPGFIPRPQTFSNFSMKRSTRIPHYWNEWKVVQCGDSVTSTRSRYRGPLATGGRLGFFRSPEPYRGNGSGDFRVFGRKSAPSPLSHERSKAVYQPTVEPHASCKLYRANAHPEVEHAAFKGKKARGLAKEGTFKHHNDTTSSSEYSDEINSPFIRPAGQGFTFRSLSETGSPPSG